MRTKPVIILFLIAILTAGFFYWQANYVKVDKAADLGKIIAPTFSKYGLIDDNLIKKNVEENKLGKTAYVSVYVEYNAPKSFVFKRFLPALRAALKNSGFSVSDFEQSFAKGMECWTVIINYGKLDVLTLKINCKGKTTLPPPVAIKTHENPKIAIVIDDFGYSRNNLDMLFGIKQQVTVSILPEQHYTLEVANRARAHGFETILHLPMESGRSDVVEEQDTIRTSMSEKEIVLHLKKEIADVPGIDGVNNHMGSKATTDTATMTSTLRYLKSRNLYFLDSLTSNHSVGVDVARSLGVRYAKRDMFLDNSSNTAAIEKQLAELKNMAFKRGEAIGICHDRKNTIAVLAKVLPAMEKEGIEFVRLSELVKK